MSNLPQTRLERPPNDLARSPSWLRLLSFTKHQRRRNASRESFKRPSVAFNDFNIKDPVTSAQASAILLYTVFHVVVGAILPICDAFSMEHVLPNDPTEHKIYLEVFLLSEYILAILGISYLQLIIYLKQKEINQYTIRERKDEPGQSTSIQINGYSHEELPSSYPSFIEPSDSVPLTDIERLTLENPNYGNHLKPNNEDKISEQSENGLMMEQKVKFASGEDLGDSDQDTNLDINSPSSNKSFFRSVSGESSDSNNQSGKSNRQRHSDKFSKHLKSILKGNHVYNHNHVSRKHKTYLPISDQSEGVNLYLRMGAVGFGFGVMVFDGFKIADQWENAGLSCHSVLWTPKHTMHLIFVLMQTYFLFKYHKISFNCQKGILRLILIHITATNVSQWLKVVVYEISEEMVSEKRHSQPTSLPMKSRTADSYNFSDSIHHEADNSTKMLHHCSKTGEMLSPFLFPCAIEFSLIGAAVFYKMFQNVGQSKVSYDKLFEPKPLKEEKTRYSECHKANKGLFLGLLVFMATLVAIGLFFMFSQKKLNNVSMLIYQSTEISLLSGGILLAILAFLRIKSLKFRKITELEAFDDNLLLIGLAGIVSYNLFLMVPAVENINEGIVAELYVGKCILEIAQSIVQVFFILEASRRCSGKEKHTKNKPGRTVVTILLASNLAMWIVNTFQVKSAEKDPLHITYYGILPWTILTRILLPLIIFFRFHSTICLSDIWSKAYRMHDDFKIRS